MRPALGAVLVATFLGLLAGCGTTKVPVDTPDMSQADAALCEALTDALPDTLSGELRRTIDPFEAPGAAWGDPAYVLTCGVPRPGAMPEAAGCLDVGGVGWYVDEDALEDPRVDITATALTHTPYVALEVPARYRTDGFDSALAELAPVLTEHLVAGEPCL